MELIARSRAIHAARVAEELATNLRYALERDLITRHGLIEPLDVALKALHDERDAIKQQLTPLPRTYEQDQS